MEKKSNRTLAVYKEAGALIRLYKELGVKTFVAISKVIPANEFDKLKKIQDKINAACSCAEDNMWRDFPELEPKYKHVFYGTTAREPYDDLDEELIAMAKEAANKLFITGNDVDDIS